MKIRLLNHLKEYLIEENSNVLYQAPVAQFNWKQEHMCDLLNLSSFSAAAEQEHLIKKVDQNLLCTNIWPFRMPIFELKMPRVCTCSPKAKESQWFFQLKNYVARKTKIGEMLTCQV